jgi:hypothetical protein
MSKAKSYRTMLTLRGSTAERFLQDLHDIQQQELNTKGLASTTGSEYARTLIERSYSLHVSSLPLAGQTLNDIGISIDSKGARIRLNKTQTEMLGLQKGDRIDLVITKHKT